MAGMKNKRGLTSKQQRFASEYVIDLDGTRAALEAGYSQHSAQQIASQLLKTHHVAAEVHRLQQRRLDRVEVTADLVVSQLWAMGSSDLRDVCSWDGERLLLKPSADIDAKHHRAIKEVKSTARGLSVVMHDKRGSLELLGRHLAMFTDRLAVDHSNVDAVEGMSDAELARYVSQGAAERGWDGKGGEGEGH